MQYEDIKQVKILGHKTSVNTIDLLLQFHYDCQI